MRSSFAKSKRNNNSLLENTTIVYETISEKDVPREFVKRANTRKFISGLLKRVCDWIVNIWDFIQNIKRYVIFGVKAFLYRIGNCFRMVSEYYSKDNEYRKTIVYSEELISVQDVPESILNKYYSQNGNMVDISQELQLYS